MKNKIKQGKLINKKQIVTLLIIVIIAIITLIYFFYKNINKNLNFGNNLINKTSQEIEEYILNISSYEADIQLTVESNKNKTQYKMKQSYISPNIEKQIIQEPKNIEGLQTIYDGNKLTIQNSKLNLSTIYENYPYVMQNFLWLNSFISEYKEAKNTNGNYKIYEENNQVIMEVNLKSSNPYVSSKKLFIDKANR